MDGPGALLPALSLSRILDWGGPAQVLVLALVAAAMGALLLLERRRWLSALADRDARVEALQDEIWELKEAAVARERAEAASEAKSRFLATVSHEIRTPLSGILGMADLIAGSPLNGEQRAYVDAIKTSGKALASLIDEILDFSKIEAGRVELVEEPVDIELLVQGVVELLAPRAYGKGLEIAAFLSSDVPREILCDGARLRQILMNLAGNAVKFTESGGVGVSVTRVDAGTLRFMVDDTGIGIAPDRQSAIFHEFEQADTSSTRVHHGTGLGLAISRRLVDYMGGEISLHSRLGAGSEFMFTLPFGQALDSPRHGDEDRERLRGRRVLIVADTVHEAPYLAAVLEEAGLLVTRVVSAAETLDALRREPPPDFAIVDCALGESALRTISAASRTAGVPKSLLLFSPFERRAIGGESLRQFDGWLVKPVRARSVFARLAGSETAEAAVEQHALPLLAVPVPGLKVLLAEDDPINAMIALAYLDRLGAAATHAIDGARAVDAVTAGIRGERDRFEAAVMDIRMPGLDGHEAARRIRQVEGAAGVPRMRLVAVTANVSEEDRRACLEAGFDAFLTKPVDVVELGAALSGTPKPAPDLPRREQVVA